jgi:hypothetical protein
MEASSICMQAHCQLADPIPSLSPFSSNNDMADNQSKDNMLSKTVRVAVTQAEPEWLDLNASVKKTCSLIEEAAGQGAKLISFPECWIPGYPAWVWFAEWFSIHEDLSADMYTGLAHSTLP